MDEKYIGIYIILLGLSGISFIVSMLFIISNITYIKEGGNTGFNYFFIINLNLLLALLAIGLFGGLYYLAIRYFKKK